MSKIIGFGTACFISKYFRFSKHVATFPNIWRETRKMATDTPAEISVEPPAKKLKTMPSETTNGAHNGMNETEYDSKTLVFHKLSENAFTPTRGSDHAVGFDLYSARDIVIKAQGKECVPTDIQIMLPEGCYGRVAPRSGLAAKKHIDVGAGVIDRDYRGPVGVVLFNHAQSDFEVKKGDRIAQLICEKAFIPQLVEANKPLPDTTRGAGGFGSTGGFQNKEEKNGAEKAENGKEIDTEAKKNGYSSENGDAEKKDTETANGAEPMEDKPSEEVKA